MVGSILTLMLLTGANPAPAALQGCCGPDGVFSPYYCPHRQLDECPGQEVYAQTSPHRPYPARTAWMWRYTYRYGINYARPSDFRVLYDYPWHKRGDSLPRYTAQQLMDAQQQIELQQEEWIPIEQEPPGAAHYEVHAARTPAVNALQQPAQYRSTLSARRMAP